MSPSVPPAVFFHADAIEGEGKDLVGRRAAGQSFLRGFLKHVPGDHVRVVTTNQAASKAFEDVARGFGERRPIQVRRLRGESDFTACGTIFFPGPGYMNAAWRRIRFGPQKCSLVGITHTVSTRRVIEGLHRLMLEPVEPWDAIICTSRAVRSVVQQQFDVAAEFIAQRFDAGRVPLPQLPVIPLGIHTVDFAQDDAHRAAMRQRFAVPSDAVVVMTMGRLTSVEKANPAPLLMALEEIAKTSGRNVHLWMVGWSSRIDETRLHERAAKGLAPSVSVKLIDGRKPDLRRHIWAGADLFTLPVDNIQETFGLVPVEAMAAGLPVVMPDWNGFRDTVVHGETGFLIPTLMPEPGTDTGNRLAARFADGTDDYLRYLSLIQQQTQIDIRAYVTALAALIDDPALRRAMGQAGQRHARAHFDWAAVIPQYLALADELAQQRDAAETRPPPPNPIEIDPFALYAAYPSAHAGNQTIVTHRRQVTEAELDALDQLNGRALYARRIMPNLQMARLSLLISQEINLTVAELASKSGQRPDVVIGAVLFLAKYDFVTLTPQRVK